MSLLLNRFCELVAESFFKVRKRERGRGGRESVQTLLMALRPPSRSREQQPSGVGEKAALLTNVGEGRDPSVGTTGGASNPPSFLPAPGKTLFTYKHPFQFTQNRRIICMSIRQIFGVKLDGKGRKGKLSFIFQLSPLTASLAWLCRLSPGEEGDFPSSLSTPGGPRGLVTSVGS